MRTDNALAVEENIRRLVAKATKNDEIQLANATTFHKLGVDSLETVHILVALEDIYGIDLEDKEMKSIEDMGGFIDYVKKKVDGKKETLNPQPERLAHNN
jgi:acyl carrier protein